MGKTNDKQYINFVRITELANKYRIFKRNWQKKHRSCVGACMICGIDFGEEDRIFGGMTRKGKIFLVCEKCAMKNVK